MLIGAAAMPVHRLQVKDSRVTEEYLHSNEFVAQPFPYLHNDACDDPGATWETPWWPTRGMLMGSSEPSGGADGVLSGTYYDAWPLSGASGRLAFVGYTRDAYGSPLGGVTVRCFVTSSNELVSQVVSDDKGYYVATTPYNQAHFLTVHKSGSPSVAGASLDTLTPA